MTTLMEPSTVGTHRSTRRMWAILGLVLLADALDVIDATVTNIAAPTIARDLHGGAGLIKWLGTAYLLAMGVLLVVGGRLGDKSSRRLLTVVRVWRALARWPTTVRPWACRGAQPLHRGVPPPE